METLHDYASLNNCGLGSRWTIMDRVKSGDFPPPDCYLKNSPRWKDSTVQAWVESLPKQRPAA